MLAYDKKELVVDERGQPVTRWDGVTFKISPVTGASVPDPTARIPIHRYLDPKMPSWPKSDFVVGNPPFIGNFRMRDALGDGYTDAVRAAYPELPESIDFVMYWWHLAAVLIRKQLIRRFGLITTNSIRQTFNRQVLKHHLAARDPLSLLFAVPDHPWVDSADGAAVRIAMTVASAGVVEGALNVVVSEHTDPMSDHAEVTFATSRGMIGPNLTIGSNVSECEPLRANDLISCPGVKLHGAGFLVSEERARLLGLGRIPGLEKHIRPYRNGRDITQRTRNLWVIDLLGLSAQEVQAQFPEVYQHILETVKPERDQNSREGRREKWWLFGEPISTFRPALASVTRYIATPETAKHRFFVFLDAGILPDNMLTNIAAEDAYLLGILSSRIHVSWALAAGGTLEDRPRYNKTVCFEPFPFPAPTAQAQERIRSLAEALDAHRRRQQAIHNDLTLTDMYNVLEKLRRGEELTAKDRQIHERGLVSVLRQIHDELDAAVAEAYGWPADLPDEEILRRLVALNAQRAEEESRGIVRWLRPDFQNPTGSAAAQGALALPADTKPAKPKAAKKAAFPKSLAEQTRAVRSALQSHGKPVSAAELARTFQGARADKVQDLLETLASLGQARAVEDGRFAA